MLRSQYIKLRSFQTFFIAGLFALGSPVRGQSDATSASPSRAILLPERGGLQSSGPLSGSVANPPAGDGASSAKPKSTPPSTHRLGPFNISVNWRVRTEAWDFFQPPTGQNAYAFEHSLLKIGIGQKSEAFEWLLEGAADTIVGLPSGAVQPGR